MIDSAGLDDRGTGTGDPREDAWSPASDSPAAGSPDLQKLAQDWISLWQSELSAMAADRELQENWQATVALWAGVATAMLNATASAARHGSRYRDDRASRQAGTEPAAGAQAAAAAPDPRDAEIERLARHIAALEARLGELERGSGPRRPAKRKR
jgi:ubiquinone biosynthesis protein UbiJ